MVVFYFGIILSYIPMLQQINNGMRIPRSSDFIQYTLVIYMIEIAEGNKRKGNYLGALICSIELIFVAQVRMALVVCGLVLVMIICSKGKYRFVLMFMGLAFCVYFVVNFFLQQDSVVISLFLGTGKRYDSVFYRIIEIKYYMKYIFAGGMFGFGFNGDTELLKYSITDIGILGFFYQFGLMGIVWFISFVYVLFARLHNTKEIGVKAMVVYLIGDCISLSPLNAQRIVFLPFALLFIDMSSKLKIEAKDEYCICHFKL